MIIRQATKSDLPQIKELNWQFLLEELPHDELFKADKESKVWGRSFVDRSFRSKKWKYFISEDNGKVIGFVNGKLDRYPSIFRKKNFGCLFVTYVLPTYRRKGIGKQLLSKILEWFKKQNCSYMETDVYFKNPYANVWTKLGFKEIYKRMRLEI